MPNDLTIQRNLLNWREDDAEKSKRQKLASSGFTVSIWTISGVVLVACSNVEDFLGLDDGGGGGGRALHVHKSPVEGARIYFLEFDADGNGSLSEDEKSVQDALHPGGFTSDAEGRVLNVPASLYGKPFRAYLEGAVDADTGEELSGTLDSIADANGQHTLASPITDFIANEAGTPAAVLARILPAGEDADAFLARILDPNNYLDGSDGVEALANFLDARPNAQDSAVQTEIADNLPTTTPTDPTDTLEVDSPTLPPATLGEHDRFVGKIDVVSHTGTVRYSFVDPTSSSIYTINERGVISVIEGMTPTATTLQIAVTNGADTEMVSVEIMVAASTPTLTAPATTTATVAENASGVDLIMGIGSSGASDFVVRAPGGLSSKFQVVSGTGGTFNLALKSGESLDFEAIPADGIEVQVWGETGAGVRSNTLKFTIMVTDANDAPVFLPGTDDNGLAGNGDTVEIAENAGRGAEVARVRAHDADANSAVSYAITGGNTGNIFSIDDSGVIRVADADALDYDTAPTSYTLTISATDGLDASGAPDTSADATATVTIMLTDANDETPRVTAPDDTIRTTTGNTADTNTGYSITVTDADAEATNTFSVTSTDPRFRFEREGASDTWNLILLANQAVTAGTISLGYSVTDGANPVSGTITLMAVDTPVEFTAPTTTTIPLDENNAANLAVATVTATSSDNDGTVHIKSFALVDDFGGIFSLATTGASTASAAASITIASANALDYETTQSYTLRVLATDDNDETNTLTLTIRVGDENDNDATFAQTSYTIDRDENLAPGARVFSVEATDADGTAANSNVRYTIAGGSGMGLFVVNENTGAISVAAGATLDYEAARRYTLDIAAYDGLDAAGNPDTNDEDDTTTITINLNDLNDNAPRVTADAGTIRTTTGNAAETNTGYSITVTDADAEATNSFSVTPSDPRFRFEREGTSDTWNLMLLANQAVTVGTISLGYSVTDGANPPVSGTITLTAVDTPVSFPTPPTATDLMVNEGDATWSLTLTAQSVDATQPPADRDSSIASYDFIGDHTGFAIDNNGVITLTGALDYEAGSTHTLTIQATDSRATPEMGQTSITITVQNVEEGPADYEITENDAGTMLSVALADADSTSATYSEDPDGRVGGVSYQWFTTDGTTHTIIDGETSATLSLAGRPADESYGVYIGYRDGSGRVYTHTDNDDDTTIAVLASSVSFSGTPTVISPMDGATASTNDRLVTGISASGGTGTIEYSFLADPYGIFQIHPSSGIISVNENFGGGNRGTWDYERASSYELVIIATDGGTGGTGDTATIEVTINVQDVNDNAPVIGEVEVVADSGAIPGKNLEVRGDDITAMLGSGITTLAGATSGDDSALAGTAADEWIYGEAGDDTITGGGGTDHIIGGAGDDTITLSSAAGSEETIYYRFSSAGTGAWVGSDGTDTITNFRRGEDKLVFLDTDGTPIDLTTFLSASNVGSSGGQLTIFPIFNSDADDDTILGVEIRFGSNKVIVNYHSDDHVLAFGSSYLPAAEPYVGTLDSVTKVPAGYSVSTSLLTDNTLLANYFNPVDADVLISERRTNADGAFASVTATDADGTSPNNEIASYSITGGTGMNLFVISSNGEISVKDGAALDYDTATSYTLTITATDGGTPAMTSADPKTITIGILEDNISEYSISDNAGVLTATLDTPDADGVVGAVSYQWFKIEENGDRTNVGTDSATYTPPAADADLIHGVYIGYRDGFGTVYTHTDNDATTTVEALTSPIKFSQSAYTGSVNEDGTAATLPTISASVDGASGHSFTYQFLHSDNMLSTIEEDGTFVIDRSTGVISLDDRANYENIPRYELTVRATYDSNGATAGGDIEIRDVKVVITIGDVNDNAPVIEEVEIAEGPGVIPGNNLLIRGDDITAMLGSGTPTLAGATSGDDSALAGTAADEWIYGDAGDDTITSGGGTDHIIGGAGDDTITLSDAAGSVETIYYRFASTDSGAWTSSDGSDTITNFRRGEDRLILLDTDGTVIDLNTFIDHNNLAIRALRASELLTGVEILFGTTKVLEIRYHSSDHVQVYNNNTGAWILDPAEAYLGDIPGDDVGDGNPTGYTLSTRDVDTTTLLPNYFNVVDADVLISERRTNADGVIATVRATDADGTSPNNEVEYSITTGNPGGVFAINNDGEIRVAAGKSLDYDTKSEYALTIRAYDGGPGDGLESDLITVTIGILEDNISEYSISDNAGVLTAELDTPDSDGVDEASVVYRWFTTPDAGTTKNDITGIAVTNAKTLDTTGHTRPSGEAYGVEIMYDDNAGNEETAETYTSSVVFPFEPVTGSINVNITGNFPVVNKDFTAVATGGGTITYSTGGTDGASFEVVRAESSGRQNLYLKQGVTLTPGTLELTVIATEDAGMTTASVAVTIIVTASSPAKIPNRQEPIAHDPYEPDDQINQDDPQTPPDII